MARIGCDVSNYTGDVGQATIDQLVAWHVDHAIVGTQIPKLAKNQLATFTLNYFTTNVYCQFDANKDEYEQALSVQAALEDYDPSKRVWVAVEQIAIPWTSGPAAYRYHFERMLNNLRGLGFHNLGIYTSRSQWLSLMNGVSDYADANLSSYMPLWYANYDDTQKLDRDTWARQGFGGWWRPEWKQYQQNYSVNEQVVDFNVSPSP
jgi:hypothetical protein